MTVDIGQLKRHYNDFVMSRARLRDYMRLCGGVGDPQAWAENLLQDCGDILPEPIRRSEGRDTYEELLK